MPQRPLAQSGPSEGVRCRPTGAADVPHCFLAGPGWGMGSAWSTDTPVLRPAPGPSPPEPPASLLVPGTPQWCLACRGGVRGRCRQRTGPMK